MNTDHVKEQIRSFLKKNFPGAGRHRLSDDEALLATGIVDSLGVLDLVSFLEKQFQIRVADEELTPENFETIAALTSLICSKRADARDFPREK